MNHRDRHKKNRRAPASRRGLAALRHVNGSPLFVLIALCVPAVCRAQGPAVEPPVAGRPAQFSDVVGTYTIGATAAPTRVAVEEAITLRVRVEGNGPAKYRPERRRLKIFPESWARDFYVEPVPDADRFRPDEGSWEFVYRLRPRHQDIPTIDGIKLVYYRPPSNGRPGRYQFAYADPIPITVLPPAAAPAVPAGLPVRTAPASFYALPASDAILATPPEPTRWPAWLTALVLLAPPVVTVLGVRRWRAWLPGPGRPAHRTHSRAARRALHALEGAGEPVWGVLAQYLRERLGFPAAEATPADVRHFLRRRGVSRPIADDAAALLGRCDAARFAGNDRAAAAALGPHACRLIGALEDDLCTP